MNKSRLIKIKSSPGQTHRPDVGPGRLAVHLLPQLEAGLHMVHADVATLNGSSLAQPVLNIRY